MGATLYPAETDLTGMVRVPEGEFTFGMPDSGDEEVAWDCVAQRQAHLEEFWIDRTPVTYAQYRQFVSDTGYLPAIRGRQRAWEARFLPYLWNTDRTFTPGLDEMPVVFVTWYDALAYCEWAGKTLPTELEWEKAARGTDGRRFPWGDDPDPSRYCNAPPEITLDRVNPLAPVGAFPAGASPYGCLDMMGNAAEWCWNSYYQPELETGAHGEVTHRRVPRPFTAFHGELRWSAGRAVRGEGRTRPPVHVAARDPADPWSCSPYVGFRCVWYPPP